MKQRQRPYKLEMKKRFGMLLLVTLTIGRATCFLPGTRQLYFLFKYTAVNMSTTNVPSSENLNFLQFEFEFERVELKPENPSVPVIPWNGYTVLPGYAK